MLRLLFHGSYTPKHIAYCNHIAIDGLNVEYVERFTILPYDYYCAVGVPVLATQHHGAMVILNGQIFNIQTILENH